MSFKLENLALIVGHKRKILGSSKESKHLPEKSLQH